MSANRLQHALAGPNNNKKQFRKRKKPKKYEKSDLVMIKNFDNAFGVSKKMIPQFHGPYEIAKALRNNRYIIIDPLEFQNTQRLYKGI